MAAMVEQAEQEELEAWAVMPDKIRFRNVLEQAISVLIQPLAGMVATAAMVVRVLMVAWVHWEARSMLEVPHLRLL